MSPAVDLTSFFLYIEMMKLGLSISEVFVVSIQVPIMPGMRHEQRIPFRGQADELVGWVYQSLCYTTVNL